MVPFLSFIIYVIYYLLVCHTTAAIPAFLPTTISARKHAFCLMPDHLHLLAEGAHAHSDLREYIRLFKQHSAFELRKFSRNRLWEKSYYDYVLRPADSIESVACYIWWNPVRKHLCAFPREYPFTGSQTIDWMTHSAAASDWTAPWKVAAPA
ncbi:MAG: transposase [Candidatus Acidiferrum sp.]